MPRSDTDMPLTLLILEDQLDGIALVSAAARASFDNPSIVVARSLQEVNRYQGEVFDFAFVDLRLPDGLSIDWLSNLKRDHPKTVAIVTSLYDDDDLVFSALQAGADGYLLKGDGVENLTWALQKAISGVPPISPHIARKLMKQFRPSTSETKATIEEVLTARELEVLSLIGGGLMIKQVAAQLNIGYHTVNDNIKAIYRKLNIRTRAQAASEAARRGLL
jgi:DNA-binding NarL/FixJ family response regulator